MNREQPQKNKESLKTFATSTLGSRKKKKKICNISSATNRRALLRLAEVSPYGCKRFQVSLCKTESKLIASACTSSVVTLSMQVSSCKVREKFVPDKWGAAKLDGPQWISMQSVEDQIQTGSG